MTDLVTDMGEDMKDGPTHMLFNDVHFSYQEAASPAPSFPTWPLFPRLPAELRLHIWTLHLQRYRMIELNIDPADEDPDCYTQRNHLGQIVSGRRYTFTVRGRKPSFAPLLSLLMQVNREARRVVLGFYRIHLPFPGRQPNEQVLYLNPDYDVVYARPREPEAGSYTGFATLLVDFLHDVRAYDYKDQGLAHLALDPAYSSYLFSEDKPQMHLTPERLHPVAAASFADILRYKLLSVLFTVGFRFHTRGMGSFRQVWRFHFAQTFPLQRRGQPAGLFDWFDADPRPGLELDLLQLPLQQDPRSIARGWETLESAFGVTNEQRAAREKDDHGFRFYICPTQNWPSFVLRMADGTTRDVGAMFEEGEEWSRDGLALYLQSEAEGWARERESLARLAGRATTFPKYADTSPEATAMFEQMEKLPCTAVGMWLFPADAFKESTEPDMFHFNVSGVRPGLFLFNL